MSKPPTHSQSPSAPLIKQEDIKPEEQDVQLPPEIPSVFIKPEPSPPPKRESSESSTPAPNTKPKRTGPQLIGDLPLAEEVARATFVEIAENHYQYGTLGRSREALESMTCECQYEHGVDNPSDACGHGSDCINRLTQVECLSDDCRCRSYCQNQRFQRKEYADIEIVMTEKKGFGLRAVADMPKDTFIYEYVGDVVSRPSFMKRMREYAEEGIRHFYFMMLQKDEYIDATKRGGIGRFANHSCMPNCYVAKWTVGQHVRMGIFAKRPIKKDEELTFNYNVDRYGHEAQPCYCGEPNCVGFLGGKTQTDIAGMDDLFLDALGITEEVEMLGLKGSKKKKSRKLEDEDYNPILKPLVEKDIAKVVQAIRQTQSRKVLLKLLTRIKITENEAALRQIMRLRGFSLMNNILEDNAKDLEALEAMIKWPLIQRNKVDDSKIRVPVEVCAQSESDTLKGLAQKLLEYWDSLEVAYRIPKRLKANGEEEPDDQPAVIVIESRDDSRPLKKTRWEGEEVEFKLKAKGYHSSVQVKERQETQALTFDVPLVVKDKRKEIADVIAAATAAAEVEAAPTQPTPPVEIKRKSSKPSRKHQTKEEKEANKEKRLLKLVGGVVVKCMSKYSKQMDHDQFKKYAKELTHLITEKEKKSSSYKENKLDALSDEKITKIKKFAKDYIAKVLRKLEKSKRNPSSSHDHRRGHLKSSAAAEPPDEEVHMDSEEHGYGDDDGGMVMSVEQAMDLGSGSESEDADAEMDNAEGEPHHSHSSPSASDDVGPSPMEGVSEHPPDSVTPITPPPEHDHPNYHEQMVGVTLDPRLRHRDEESGCVRGVDGLHV
ncbi:hypothetical protein F5I97DRAFT_1817718 [Phlebopus sp. FC_14]|nr:hypothetical protein F5I97DRAFT_1817718 [Phlebopus sp. FC_14]